MKKIVVLVEEVEVARTALQWALHNLINYDDLIILLHVFQPSPTKISSSSRHNNNTNHHNKKQRILRLKGFQLALSFKLLCDHTIPDAKVDIAVREGDQAGDGTTIASTIREMGASALVVGIHDQSFLYKMARTNTTIINNLNCRVLAIKQPMETSTTSGENLTNFDFSQIEIGRLSLPPIPPQKIPYQILPSPFRIIWRSKRRRQEHHHQQNTGC